MNWKQKGMSIFFAFILMSCAIVSTPSYGAIYIVRHAEKLQIEKEPNPPLSDVGTKRAKTLAYVLAAVDLKAIYVTEFKRTHETAAPIATAKNITPVEVKALEPDRLADILKGRNAEEDILVVGHANIPLLLKALGVKDPVSMTEADYDNLFVVDLRYSDSPKVHRLHYGDAPSN